MLQSPLFICPARETAMQHEPPPFTIGQLVWRHGYSGTWIVSAVVWDVEWSIWMIGVEGQVNGWPRWKANEFHAVVQDEIGVSLAA